MVLVCVLASGSKGNSCYVSDGKTTIVFDVGLSAVETQRRIESKGFDPSSLSAIVVTHEHSDHIRGVKVLSRRLSLPVYMNLATKKKVVDNLGNMDNVKLFACGSMFRIGSFFIQPFSVPHDAADPAGFILIRNNVKIGIVTDLGTITGMIEEKIRECNLLIIEANHDVNMLRNGPYPWYLKQRINSKTGHLSNDNAAKVVKNIRHPNLKHVILVHLSCKNNSVKAAFECVNKALLGYSTHIHVASQELGSKVLSL